LPGLQQSLFDLEFGTDNEWSSAELWQLSQVASSDTSITYAGATLVPDQLYYCRLRVFDGLNWSPWAPRAFSVNIPPDVPQLVSPIDDAYIRDTHWPTLSVSNAVQPDQDTVWTQFSLFQVQSGLDTELVASSPWVRSTEDWTAAEWTPPDSLWEDSLYLWTARASDGYAESPPATTNAFLLNAFNLVPAKTSLLGPAEDEVIYNCAPTHVWSAIADPEPYDQPFIRYIASRATSPYFLTDVVDSVLYDWMDTSLVFGTSLQVGQRYWWQVVVLDNGSTWNLPDVQALRVYRPGDADASWSVTSSDVILLVNHVFKGASLLVPTCAADLTGEGAVNAADVIKLVNFVFKGGVALEPTCCTLGEER